MRLTAKKGSKTIRRPKVLASFDSGDPRWRQDGEDGRTAQVLTLGSTSPPGVSAGTAAAGGAASGVGSKGGTRQEVKLG